MGNQRVRVLSMVPFLLGVVLTVAGVLLGNWQVRRAEDKMVLQSRSEASASRAVVFSGAGQPAPWQPVGLEGHWLAETFFLLDNRLHGGRPGYHVFTALAPIRGLPVLVNRGWVAAGRDRSQLPEVSTPQGKVVVEGRVRIPESRPFTLAGRPGDGRLWQVLDLAALRSATGQPLADYVVFQEGGGPDGLVREWPRPDSGVDRHWGYAVQWYGLAALAASLTVYFSFRQWRSRES